MSITDSSEQETKPVSRKRNLEAAEIEIDVEAPEPPSKKALRKAKKSKTTATGESATPTQVPKTQQDSTKATQKDHQRSQYGIWIGNLSFGTTKDDLLRFFTTHSSRSIPRDQITRIHLPLGPAKFGKPANKGFAYIDFADASTLDIALEFSEALLDGRRVLIKNAKSFEGRPDATAAKGQESEGKPASKRIFVGNLDFETTAEELEQHFGRCGAIVHTHMATFEDSGKCKGYAWVDFEQLSSAQAAMRGWVEEQDSDPQGIRHPDRSNKRRVWLQKLKGRKLRMEFAEDKATRYQKRFGKGSKADQEDEAQDVSTLEVADGSKSDRRPKRDAETRSTKPGKYTEEMVQRLTGAIVEAKGKKTTFG
ncbi:hypothetical protein B0A52_01233 [Exophiala mesophila]|uniref:RRM domain-containing protein n=1 Tax=Exophiala mesophila TaxID=212818 RepID=A0A438NGX1_EXOME|nr:hypothetical protein B0A52_01233 [Exophiala mesophila]